MSRAGVVPVALIVVAASAAAGWVGPLRIVHAVSARVVALRASPLTRRAERCSHLTREQRIACVDGVLLPAARLGQLRLAMSALEQLAARDSEAAFLAHSYAHAIGMAAVDAGADVYESFEACSPRFDAGCYHGVMQIALGRASHVGKDDVNRLCGRYLQPRADAWFRYQCAHGVGHGLTMFYAYDLPRSAAACDFFPTDADQRACLSGALMENSASLRYGGGTPVTHAVHSHRGMPGAHGSTFRRFDPAQPHYPCSALNERFLDDCYHAQPALILAATEVDYGAAVRMCDGAPARARKSCYHGFGNQIAVQAAGNHAEANRLCALVAADYRSWCIDGFVKSRVSFTGNPQEGLAFCGQVVASADRTQCFGAFGWQLLFMGVSQRKRAALCAVAVANDAAACRLGARIRAKRTSKLRNG